MSDSKCTHCGANMHRLTRWCQRCGKSAGNPEIPISYPTIPAQNIKPNPTNILSTPAEVEPSPTANTFNYVPQSVTSNPAPSQGTSAFNFLPQSVLPKSEPSTRIDLINVSAPSPISKSESTEPAKTFNFLPQSVVSIEKPSYDVPEYAAVDQVIPLEPGFDSSGVWRDGIMMVAVNDAVLPNRCVKCNDIAETERITTKLSWHHPLIYLLLLLNFLIYGVVALIMRKQAVLDLPLCTRHKSNRKMMTIVGIATIVLGFGLLAMAFSLGAFGGFFISIVTVIAGIAICGFGRRIVATTKIENNYVWVKGVNRDFLRQLPSV